MEPIDSDASALVESAPPAGQPAPEPDFAFEVGDVLTHRYNLTHMPEGSSPAHLYVVSRRVVDGLKCYDCRVFFADGRGGRDVNERLVLLCESEVVSLRDFEQARAESRAARAASEARKGLERVMSVASAMLDDLDRRAS